MVIREDLADEEFEKKKKVFFDSFSKTYKKYERNIYLKSDFGNYIVKEGIFKNIAEIDFLCGKEGFDIMVVTNPKNFELINTICKNDTSGFKIVLKCSNQFN